MAPRPDSMELKITAGLVLQPGDTLVVAVNGPISMDQADRIKRGLEDQLPALADVVIVVANDLAAYRPGDPRRPSTTEFPEGYQDRMTDRIRDAAGGPRE